MNSNSSKRLKPDDLVVNGGTAYPGWLPGSEVAPRIGDRVYCTAGVAEVTKLCGKSSDGGRILELKLVETQAPPFFAASSNVLVAPRA
jgi:hypothetical protein